MNPPKPEEELKKQIKALLDEKPDLIPPPDGLWESIHATWTGLWTDFYGSWDERQASDVFPISDLLSSEREDAFVKALATLIRQKELEAASLAQRRLCEALKRAVHEHPEWPMDDIVALLYKETGDLIEAEAAHGN